MPDRGFDYAAEAFTFIEALEGLSTASDANAMERTFALFGFENFIATGCRTVASDSSRSSSAKVALDGSSLCARGLRCQTR